MVFNSLAFFVFLACAFSLYWLIPKQYLRAQNLLLLVASYVFYGWWDWRFLSLIAFSSVIDYSVGRQLAHTKVASQRKRWLALSLLTNLGVLGVFKYFGFFVESFAGLLTALGISANVPTLSIILPVGISFYTFQTLSYTIDIYREQLDPIDDVIAFFAFVSFFPQLVAGPIERAANLLPQFQTARTFTRAGGAAGLQLILWGLFKKVVIADNLASVVDLVFGNYGGYSGQDVAVASVFFAVQIYCDFSGYSDMAIGTAKLFGFDLMRNFATPYFATSIQDFWRRWHISLSTWFRDYVFIPLGGNRVNAAKHARNIMLTFLLSGLWHGANWTFVVWGGIHGLLYLPRIVLPKRWRWPRKWQPIVGWLTTIPVVVLAWIFFRANSIGHAVGLLLHVGLGGWGTSQLATVQYAVALPLMMLSAIVIGLFVVEYLQRDKACPLFLPNWPVLGRWAAYYGVIALILFYGKVNATPFIYFQF